MTRGRTAMVAILLLSLIIVAMPMQTRAATPTITLSPDANLTPNEAQFVNGTNHPANVTVSIDLVLPDGNRVDGVTTGTTDALGTFALSFKSPDRTGDGYIVVSVNGTPYSILVKFVGLRTDNLTLNLYPATLKTNETFRLEITNEDLVGKNYVILLTTAYPNSEITTGYYVLHDGLCNIERTVTMAGTYVFNASIDGTTISKRVTATFAVGTPSGGGGGGGGNQTTNITNITWYVTKSNNVYSIQIADNLGAYITSGTIALKKPDNTQNTLTLSTTGTSFTAADVGEYELIYAAGGKQFVEKVTYSPTVRFTVSQFSSAGTATMTLTIDNKAPTDTVTVSITGENSNTVFTETLTSGSGSFAATTPDSYAFSIDYAGTQSTKYSTYSDNYIINSLSASQSSDRSALTISGTLVGEKSSRGIANTLVKIQIDYLGYINSIRTTTDGSFRVSIALPTEKRGDIIGGTMVDVKAQYGVNDASTTTVKLEHDFWGEYGLWLGIIIVFALGILWVTGILTWATKGRIAKPFEGGGGGGGVGFGATRGGSTKTLLPNNIHLKPPKQMGLG